MKKLTKSTLFRALMPLFLVVVLSAAYQVGFTHIPNLFVDHDLIVGNDLTVTNDLAITGDFDVDGATTLNSTLDVDGNITSGTGAVTVTDQLLIDGAADALQLVVQGYTTQTTVLGTFEQSDGTDVLTFTNAGGLYAADVMDVDGATTLNSTLDVDGNLSSGTDAFTIADNTLIDGAADAIQLTVQGFTTQTNSLLVLEQSDGTDVATVSNAGNTDVAGTLQFGADNLYALGYVSSAQQFGCVSTSITGTAAVAVTGITTPTFVMLSMVSDPGTGAGDPAMITFDAPTTTSVVVNSWQDDFTTAATSAVSIHLCAIGDE